ncbi:hypothetical protein Pcinc_001860 [Petrolisthes cinctipes]|uniref:Uncharacterized protein n=1 Tax=Petrolisthes cinctipes TaxID=88211 RepID=A0AAE1L5S1_PETCI|nr:hypothetical protein Pcinc_001860 [Petrolisthes cinctipes]
MVVVAALTAVTPHRICYSYRGQVRHCSQAQDKARPPTGCKDDNGVTFHGDIELCGFLPLTPFIASAYVTFHSVLLYPP